MTLYDRYILDYDALLDDHALVLTLQSQMLVRGNKIFHHEKTIEHIERVLGLIEAELN